MNEKSKTVMSCKAVYKITTWFTMRYIQLSENISVFGRMVGGGDNPHNRLHKNVSMLLYKVRMKFILQKLVLVEICERERQLGRPTCMSEDNV
jgi:hypothetical protein